MMSPGKIIFVLAGLVALLNFHCMVNALEPHLKCTEQDNRQVYPYCMLHEDSLWCDQSAYKKLPSVQDINAHLGNNRDCTVARILYVNDSCLETISEADLQPYEKISTLYGGKNKIVKLMSKTFEKNKELREIDLCSNQIKSVDMHTFKGLKHLKIIHLDNNQITVLHPELFDGLHSLRIISVNNNHITEILKEHFSRLHKLHTLSMKDNSIQRIDERAFHGLKDLRHLHLDGNRITIITPHTFSGLENLKELTLSKNGIQSWPRGYGSILINLHILHLGSNKISEILLPSHMENMTKLESLSLDDNLISRIPGNLFTATPQLKHLNLSSNQIKDIPAETFAPLKDMKSLLIKDNSLTVPKTEWFEHMFRNSNGESHVDIAMNEWDCNCKTLEFLDHIVDLKEHENANIRVLAHSFQIYCHTPKRVYGQLLDPKLANEIIHEQNCPMSPFFIPTTTTTPTATRKYVEKVIVTEDFLKPETHASTRQDWNNKPIETDEKEAGGENSNSDLVILLVCSLLALLIVILLILIVRKYRPNEDQDESEAMADSSLLMYLDGNQKSSSET